MRLAQRIYLLIGFTFITLALGAPQSVAGPTYGFGCITDNGNNCAAMAPQLTMEVLNPGGGQVNFSFVNGGPIASAITEIYWDDNAGVLASLAGFTPGSGVSWTTGASPGALPSQSSAVPPFTTDSAFNSEASGNTATGIQPTESLILTFNLAGVSTVNDVVSALDGGTLRAGMHVRAIGTAGGSDALVNTGQLNGGGGPVVPEPASVLLMSLGAAGAIGLRRILTRK